MNPALLSQRANTASELLKALANPSRLQILCLLIEGEKAVHEIERSIGLRQSALSQHLAILRRERMVTTRRHAQFIHYALASDKARKVIEVLYQIYCAPKAKSASER